MKAKQEKSAGAIVFYLDKENNPIYLLLKNTLKTTYWGFPKGHIEKNETVEQTIKREVEEETSLNNINILSGFQFLEKWFFKLRGELIRKEAIYLLAEVPESDKGSVKISEEHQEFRWGNFQEALQLLKIKQNRETLVAANNFINEWKKQKKLF